MWNYISSPESSDKVSAIYPKVDWDSSLIDNFLIFSSTTGLSLIIYFLNSSSFKFVEMSPKYFLFICFKGKEESKSDRFVSDDRSCS